MPVPCEVLLDWEADEAGAEVPARITAADFRRYFLASFPKLAKEEYDQLIEGAIDMVYAMFTGVGTIWDKHPEKAWHRKTQACYRLLTAWYIANHYPGFVAGVTVTGGPGLKKKKVDGVMLEFDTDQRGGNKHYEDLLKDLASNVWGREARMMIRGSGKRAELRNRRFV